MQAGIRIAVKRVARQIRARVWNAEAGTTLACLTLAVVAGCTDDGFMAPESPTAAAVAVLADSVGDLTVAELQVPSGVTGERTSHGGDAMLVGVSGELMVRTHWKTQSTTFALEPRDAVFIPETAEYEVLSFSRSAT